MLSRVDHIIAERVAGRRLDRRRRYAVIDGQVCMLARWTQYCSGCTDVGDYGTLYGPFGCDECGHTGKRRVVEWVPIAREEMSV